VEPLSRNEIADLIETFWRLDSAKVHLADFLPIMDEGFFIRAVDTEGREVARFDGLAGLEDHQNGKMDMFDEQFRLSSLDYQLTGDTVVAHTTATWSFRYRVARAATSTACVADLTHEWYLRRHPVRLQPVMTGHTCTHFAYRPGQAPPQPDDRQAVEESSVSLHVDPGKLMHDS
jgi:hypothetical protein